MPQIIQDVEKNVLKTCHDAGLALAITSLGDPNTCFDIAASNKKLNLLIKVVKNADSVTEDIAKELAWVAKRLAAEPVIISEKRSKNQIEPGAVYERHGVAVIAPDTLSDVLLKDILPCVYVKQGGVFARINVTRLRQIREEKNISLGALANLLGVSRRSIYEYERGTMDPAVGKAARLEELFGPDILQCISPFTAHTKNKQKEDFTEKAHPDNEIEEQVADKLETFGVETIFPRHTPFDAIASMEKQEIITGISYDKKRDIRERLICMVSLSKVLHKPSVFFVDDKEECESYKGLPILDFEELDKIANRRSFLKVISHQKTR